MKGIICTEFMEFAEGVESIDFVDLLNTLENHIHAEVRRLYPDAELPKFETEQPSQNEMHMHYTSVRCLGDFAFGLLKGCIAHFGGGVELAMKDDSGKRGDVVFVLTRD